MPSSAMRALWKALKTVCSCAPSEMMRAPSPLACHKPCPGCWARTQAQDSARIDGTAVENSPIC